MKISCKKIIKLKKVCKGPKNPFLPKLDYLREFSLIIFIGRKGLTPEESAKLGGGYNTFLQTSLPENLRVYNPDEETFESSQRVFRSIFIRGFAIEVLHVFSGPPEIVYKFRHWGYMEGPFKGHAPTGELVELFGIGIFELDKESNKIVKAEFFLDRGEFLAPLVKGERNGESASATALGASKCSFMKELGNNFQASYSVFGKVISLLSRMINLDVCKVNGHV
ncbi:pathogen-related protein-like [Lycium barbarum]|uniref:pathogen-related protein-like n=1 Tax=Lycium barbarum TaxID=112863 RepID=UPI00293E9478|nr:pathogen-related protein-like [Lycium barbarum]